MGNNNPPLGRLEFYILKILKVSNRKPLCGLEIQNELSKYLDNSPSLFSVYGTLSRLSDKGFVDSKTSEEGEHARKGRKKVFFSISDIGKKVSAEQQEELKRFILLPEMRYTILA